MFPSCSQVNCMLYNNCSKLLITSVRKDCHQAVEFILLWVKKYDNQLMHNSEISNCWQKISTDPSKFIMVTTGSWSPYRPHFFSLSPDDHPLPSCLSGTKQELDSSLDQRYKAALFPAEGNITTTHTCRKHTVQSHSDLHRPDWFNHNFPITMTSKMSSFYSDESL